MIKWTPKSEQDINEILDHIAKHHGNRLAVETITQLVKQVEETLNTNPLIGTLIESNPLFSKVVVDGNSVYYCENPQDKNIYIVYVRARKTNIETDRFTELLSVIGNQE